jgi:cytidine deaminase
VNENRLLHQALHARERAYAPYSEFRVGAALLGSSGTVYTGCNIENSSFGLTMCAERVAIYKAVSEGERTFEALCVVADSGKLTPPCGACRQIIWEFCGDIPVTLANPAGESRRVRMRDLLPLPFDGQFLAGQEGDK